MEIMEPFRDLLMEGLSAKLKSFEDANSNYLINMEPRLHYASAQHEEKKSKVEAAQKNLGMLRSNILGSNPNMNQALEKIRQQDQQNL